MSIKANPIFARLITAKKITARLIQTFSKICRYFSTFDGSTSYAALTDEIVLSGDFEIEFKCLTTNTTQDQAIFDSVDFGVSGVGKSLLYIDTPNGLDFVIPTAGTSFTRTQFGEFSNLTNGQLNTVAVGRSAGVIYAKLNDVSLTATGVLSSNIDVIFDNVGGLPRKFDGQLSDLKIWDGGDRTTGDLILDLPMSEGLKDVYDEVFYLNRVQAQAEWLLNLGGGYSLHQRLWNPDATDPSFSLEAYFDAGIFGTIISQNIARSEASRELHILCNNNLIKVVIGGSTYNLNFASGAGLYRVDFNGSNVSLFKGGIQAGSSVAATVGNSRESNADFRIGTRANDSNTSAEVAYTGVIRDVKFWVNGTKSTGDLVLDSALDDNSNIIANAASPVNANVWTGTVTATGESSGDINSVNVLSTAGASSQVSVPATVAGDDVLIELTLSSGSLDNIIAGDSSTEFTGWQNIRDNDGQPTNRYQTLMNNNDNEIVFKVSGIADATFTNITARVVEGYGVLQGTRGTDYEWKDETPHAIGYNVETNEVCTSDGTNWVDADLWNDSDAWSD